MLDERDFLRVLSEDGAKRDFFKAAVAKGTCDVCPEPMTRKILWAEGKAYVPSCEDHVAEVTKKHDELFDYGGPDGIKKASVAGAARNAGGHIKKLVQTHKGDILAGLGGAALAGGGQYLVSKKGKDGKSKEQRAADSLVAASNNPQGYSAKTLNEGAKASRGFANVDAEYPGKAALKMIPIGAGAGIAARRLLTKK